MKRGLVLEGGAMRGLFSAGVMDVMMENGIRFDGGIGVSAGAAFGVNYKSGQVGRALRYNLRFVKDKRYSGWHSFFTTGNIYNVDFCYNQVPLKYDPFDFEAYGKDPMEFYVVCADVVTGESVYHRYDGFEDHGFEWIRASASMPLVSTIVEIDGMKLLDGGMTDSIPVRYFQSIGYDRSVVILTQPLGYQKKKNSMMPLVKMKYRKYPGLVRAMETRHIMYNETLDYIAKEEAEGRLLVIRPEVPLPAGKVEKDVTKLQETYDIGRAEGEKRLEEIRRYLGE